MANIADKSLDSLHISSDLESYEAARSGFFVFNVAPDQLKNLYNVNFNRDSSQEASITNNGLYDGTLASEYLRLNVVKAALPKFTVEAHEYRRGNNVVRYAGVPTFEGGNFVVDDVVGLETKSLLYSWLYLAYDPRTRKGGRMKDYKKKATLSEYTQDYQLIRTWTLYGVFITGIDEDDFDKENDAPRKLSISISYDYAEMSTKDATVATKFNNKQQ